MVFQIAKPDKTSLHKKWMNKILRLDYSGDAIVMFQCISMSMDGIW